MRRGIRVGKEREEKRMKWLAKRKTREERQPLILLTVKKASLKGRGLLEMTSHLF